MYIAFKNSSNIENNKTNTSLEPMQKVSLPHSLLSSLNNPIEERPLKSNSQNLNFKGLSSPKVSDLVKNFSEEIGASAAKNLEETITRLTSTKNSGVTLKDGHLKFKDDNFADKFYRAAIDPALNLPRDSVNLTLKWLKKTPLFKNSKFIDNILETKFLKARRISQENYSNAMALRHHLGMLEDEKAKDKIFNESQKRLNTKLPDYTTKADRAWTRTVTGLIPAFFLANDAYNLSMYVNNNKDLAKKEKKRRFNQEVARVLVTAAATFIGLGFFAKKSNANPESATALIATFTLASELIGRLMVGTPPYPIGRNEAKKYAKLQQKDKLHTKNDNTKSENTSSSQKGQKKSDYVVKLLGAMVLLGFGVEHVNSIKPLRRFLKNFNSRFNELFIKDSTISKKEFSELMSKLRENGFEKMADKYQKIVDQIIKEGNLTAKESHLVERRISEKEEKLMPKNWFMSPSKLKKAKNTIKEKINREGVIKEFNFAPKNNEIINIGSSINKPKEIIIKQVLMLPIKFGWEILMMPYRYVVKPIVELPIQWYKNLAKKFISKTKSNSLPIQDIKPKVKPGLKKDENKDLTENTKMLQKSIGYLKKHSKDASFKDKLNKTILDSFDDVNKSNFSNAELSGSAKIAVSTVTSAFLISDNYNMVMIDTEGKDKKLAEQKAKERTIQRIVRIAYGACIIKLFNGIFKTQYDASMVGAQGVNTISTIITEILERKSVGLPLHEATREEIIEEDQKNLNAKGFKGFRFKLMSKLTGKKPLSERKPNKKD